MSDFFGCAPKRRRASLVLRALFSLACVMLVAMASTTASHAQKPLRVAAAADLSPVLPDVIAAWEKQTGMHADASFQSSATLAQQIVAGAPFDLFFSADTGFAQRVIQAGLAVQSTPTIYAQGTLVLWARKDAPILHGKPISLSVLQSPELQSIAIATPDRAPYGRAAEEAIASMGLTQTLAGKLRTAANIAQTAQYVDSGNAEVGFLSLTGAMTPKLQNDGTYVKIPASAYKPILQGAVTLKQGQTKAADSLLQFLATPEMRALLAARGLEEPR